ncbi:hypothetical membrane protein [Candidatus Moduliflexus flocculans]|uniref:Hypothetical membrane protein n=1 Tax=Candidatus Moduliflexus flocculans TaxID=1499966 RepID=A0A081BLA4_9BACT|nr:hypothetical membrane protein [Candidatus Moduliflexus flocculans]
MPQYPTSLVWFGRCAIFASEIFFYLASVAVRWSQDAHLELSSTFFVFVRFLIGFLLASSVLVIKRQPPRPHQLPYLLGRVFFYVAGVFCFFKAVETTTAAQGNILNMTYPIYTPLFAWLFFKQKRDLGAFGMAALAFVGMALVIAPTNMTFEWGTIWGIASGLFTGFAVIFLNLARQQNKTEVVLFFVFGIGAALLFAIFGRSFFLPNKLEFLYLAGAGLTGVIGQYVLTLGARYVSPVEGSMISSSRIIFAAFVGPLICSDPALSLTGWIGALLIFAANAYMILRSAK